MDGAAFERVVEILAMDGGAVDEGGTGRTHRPRVADRGADPSVIPRRQRRLDVILVAGGHAQANHIDQQILALAAHGGGQSRRIERRHFLCQDFGDGNLRKFGPHAAHVLRKRTPPNPGMRLTATTTAKVMMSMASPSTAMAPRSPDSLRSKISTEITLVSEVNSMMAADNSRITPTKMKHQVAITLVRRSGAVMSRNTRSRVAPRMRLASSRSVCTERNADCIC